METLFDNNIRVVKLCFSPREGILSMETLLVYVLLVRLVSCFSPREGILSMETRSIKIPKPTGERFSPREGILSMETF